MGESSNYLDEELKNLIIEIPFEEDGNKVLIQVTNPLMRDHIKNKLQQNNQLADSSFSADIIRMKPETFVKFYQGLLDTDINNEIEKKSKAKIKGKKVQVVVSGLFGLLSSLVEMNIPKAIVGLSKSLKDLIIINQEDPSAKIDALFNEIEKLEKKTITNNGKRNE